MYIYLVEKTKKKQKNKNKLATTLRQCEVTWSVRHKATDQLTGQTGLLENLQETRSPPTALSSCRKLCKAPCRLQQGTHINCTPVCYDFAPCCFPF